MSELPHRAGPAPRGATRSLDRLLERRGSGWVVLTLPCPRAPLERWLACAEGDAFLWDAGEGPKLVGWGSAVTFPSPPAPGGPRSLAPLASRELGRIAAIDAEGRPTRGPVAFGGFPFDPAGPRDGAWAAFAGGGFCVPRWCYRERGGRATLSLTVRLPGGAGLREELERFVRRAAVGPPPSPEAAWPAIRSACETGSRARFEESVRAALDRIRSGRLAKVVVARRERCVPDRPLPLPGLARRLARRPRGPFRFLLRRGRTLFAGVSPEQLVRYDGRSVASVPLAGSAPDAPGERERLLASPKQLREHDLVVEHVRARLARAGVALGAPGRPRVLRFPGILHLGTEVFGQAPGGLHVLDLVAALHPTPAVAGVPTDEALAFIREREPFDRGLYCGPIGWFDGAGRGLFALALRCARIDESGVTLYAGAGIVEGSDPAAEWNETETKLASMRAALEIDR